jgi:hypothetical protein
VEDKPAETRWDQTKSPGCLFGKSREREKTMLDLPVGVTCRSAKLVPGLSGHRTAYPDAYSSCEPSAFRSRCDPWVGSGPQI